MGNVQNNINDINQTQNTNITNDSRQACQFTNTPAANNNVIIISGSKINGNFTGVSEQVTTHADCIITSTMDNNITNTLAAVALQKNQAKTDLFNDGVIANINNNIYDLHQTVNNNINNLNKSTCSAQTISSANANYIYISTSVIKGNFIGVAVDSDANSNCSLSNVIKNISYNQTQSSVTQSNTVTGMFAGLFGGLFFIIVLILAVVFFEAIWKVVNGNKKDKKDQQGQTGTQGQQQGQDQGNPYGTLQQSGYPYQQPQGYPQQLPPSFTGVPLPARN